MADSDLVREVQVGNLVAAIAAAVNTARPWVGTKAEYDALGSHSAAVMYVIIG